MIVVNFKLYEKYLGKECVELAKICASVASKSGVKIIPVVSAFWVDRIHAECGICPLIGHVDMYTTGKRTGYLSPVSAQSVGAGGTLINHSEHRLKLGTIASTLSVLPDGFESIVCTKSMGQAERILKKTKPKYLAYEPPYLIADKTKSVASERIEVFEKIVNMGKDRGVAVLAGAGVRSKEDIKAVLDKGGAGVLMSSEIMLSEDPERVLMDLVEAFGV